VAETAPAPLTSMESTWSRLVMTRRYDSARAREAASSEPTVIRVMPSGSESRGPPGPVHADLRLYGAVHRRRRAALRVRVPSCESGPGPWSGLPSQSAAATSRSRSPQVGPRRPSLRQSDARARMCASGAGQDAASIRCVHQDRKLLSTHSEGLSLAALDRAVGGQAGPAAEGHDPGQRSRRFLAGWMLLPAPQGRTPGCSGLLRRME
jgi:hypothetical protein